MKPRRIVKTTLPLVFRPKSAWLHLLWHLRGPHNRRIRRDIRGEFDDNFYLGAYPDVRKLKIGPLRHYILRGWKEGKDPSELFSTNAYLEMYRDVAEKGVNPFQHYLVYGREEGRIATASTARRRASRKPRRRLKLPPVPQRALWDELPRRVVDPPERQAVDVIVPVYKSLQHTAATLKSVLQARCEIPFECLVIDDCSPEPEVSALLRDLAASGHIRLVVNERNAGFVESCNRGMAAHPGRDVVLLNADTQVQDGWLDRLMAPLRDDPAIATVTPLSNNATIASYPNPAVDNAYELEADAAVLDRLAATANGGTVVDVPTGVGFCLAIRRTALDALGPFDAQTFGLGYGEECDLCMRAMKAGWRNVVASGVYVRHYGSASFGPSQLARSAHAQALIARKHPDYPGRVARHISADPLLPSRILLDAARLREAFGAVSILFFSHTRGGGIDTYLENTRLALIENGLKGIARRAVIVQTQQQGFAKIVPFDKRKLPYLPNLDSLNIERHKDLLGEIIELLDPELVHINSFAGLSIPSIARLMETLKAAERPYWHVWHDHQPLCPRLTFLDSEQRYCGETDASRCVSCLASTSAPYEWVKIEDWRERFRAYLAGAEVVSAPSEAAALRARRLVDVSKVTVDPHPEPHLTGVRPLKRWREGESNGASPPKRPRNGNGYGNGKRHVLILGAIGPHKGAYLIHAMIKDIRARKLPLHMDILGYTALSEIATGPGVTVHGKYHGDADALKRIGEIGPDLCLVSSVWPETYLFTLSVPMALHLPTVAFDIGAQAERVAGYDRGVVLDEHLMEDPVSLNDALLELDVEALWSTPVNVDFRHACALSAYFSSRARSPGGEGPADRPRKEAPRDRGSGAPSGDWMSVLH